VVTRLRIATFIGDKVDPTIVIRRQSCNPAIYIEGIPFHLLRLEGEGIVERIKTIKTAIIQLCTKIYTGFVLKHETFIFLTAQYQQQSQQAVYRSFFHFSSLLIVRVKLYFRIRNRQGVDGVHNSEINAILQASIAKALIKIPQLPFCIIFLPVFLK